MEHVIECTGYEMVVTNIEQGEGYYLFDSQGKKYIDFESGVWSTPLGHNNQQVTEAIKKQVEKIIHFGFKYTNGLVEEAAKDVICTLKPFNGKCLFLSSGSEAVEFSVKIAKTMTEGRKMLVLEGTYLSAYGTCANKEKSNWIQFPWLACKACKQNFDCNRCERINQIAFEEIGAFVLEPGNSSGLVVLPPKNLVEEIAKRVKKNNGMLVVDEVTTGVGRTGKWYGYQHFDIQPDIIALGKGIGNGYPVSVVALDNKIADEIKNKNIRHAQSHQNDALGCVVVQEVIKNIEEKQLIKRSRETGQYFIDRLHELKEQSYVIKEVRGIGLMIAIEFYKGNAEIMEQLNDYLIEHGFIVGYKPIFNLMRFYPALTMSREDIDSLIECMKEVLV